MRKPSVCLFLSFMLLLSGCTASVDSNSSAGLKVTSLRLAYDSLYLAANGKRINTTNCLVGEQVNLIIYGLTGFKETSNRIYPGISLVVTDQHGRILVNKPELIAASRDVSLPADSIRKRFEIHIPLESPLTPGSNYMCRMRIWDKLGKGEFIAEHSFNLR